MRPKLISVIVPAFNSEKYLASALDSILSQNYQTLEIIVVDDGSTDNTAEIAKSYPQVRYIRQHNQGPDAARNTGLSHATGELVSFLDSDDTWLPDRLAQGVEYLEAHPEAGCVLAKIENFLEPGIDQPDWVTHEILRPDSNPWQLGTLLAHRWLMDRIGIFKPDYFPCADIEWFVRLVDSGVAFNILDAIAVRRRIHDQNVSAKNALLRQQMLRIFKDSIQRKREKKSLAVCQQA